VGLLAPALVLGDCQAICPLVMRRPRLASASVVQAVSAAAGKEDDVSRLDFLWWRVAVLDSCVATQKNVICDLARGGLRLLKSPGCAEMTTDIDSAADRGE
jgi:hypothetical protein